MEWLVDEGMILLGIDYIWSKIDKIKKFETELIMT
jgi:hypothetical protein